MSEGLSLIDLGKLSEPATVLIKKISAAVGGICEPWQIRRVAQAQADAEIIKAKAEIQITDLHRRGLGRFITEEARKQYNMEKITEKAIPLLGEGSDPKKMEDDWIANFFDKCRLISDEEMQSLWAKVLAGEANSPGKYSKRTVTFLSSLDKSDADLFTSLCGFNWSVGGRVDALIFDEQHSIYNSRGINYDILTHLDDIGLVSFQPVAGVMIAKLPKRNIFFYYGIALTVEFPKETDNDLEIGNVLLTKTGQQLAPICGSKPVDGFVDYVVERWAKRGLILSSSYPR